MTTHVLKTWPEYFQAVLELRKTFEVRKSDDRDFEVDDVLELKEWDPPEDWDAENPDPELDQDTFYTGRVCRRRVTYILRGGNFGIQRGYVVLGIT